MKRRFTTTREILEKAQGEYLTPSELKTVQGFKESLRQIYNLEQLKKEIKMPPDSQVKNLEAYDEIVEAITQKIATIRKSLQPLEVAKIEEKLQNPSTYKNIALVSHQHFLASLQILEEMNHISENILEHCRNLEEDSKEIIQATFSLSDLKENLRQQYRSLKSQQEISENKLSELRKKVIKASRAMKIAKNIFLNGDLKKLNAEKRNYEKAVKNFNSDLQFFSEQKLKLENVKVERYAEKFQQVYYQTKTKIELEQRQEKLKKWQSKLDDETNRLENLCATNDAKQKIAIIAASILRKNLPHVQNFEKEKKKLAAIKQELKLTKERLNFVSDNSSKKKYYYRVIETEKLSAKILRDKKTIVSLIADALSGEKNAVQLVARSTGNNLEMEKEWETMSDLNKDELIHKQVFRNL